MVREERTNYTLGYVVEYLEADQQVCKSWLLVPAENLWPVAFRGFLYLLALAYLFLGIAIASDVFMCSIEVITSKKRKVVRWDEERQQKVEREVLLWNETVANLTLMALGSSAPEILLATGEMIGDLDSREARDGLGTFTIIGSAAFNMLIITAVCVLSVPTGTVKYIKEQGVFIVTSIWSIWAYVWMLLVVKYITPGQIDPWEAWITLGYLPVFVFMSYVTDRGWLCGKKKVGLEDLADGSETNDVNVRVVGHQHQNFVQNVPKELRVLEAEKAQRMSIGSVDGSGTDHPEVAKAGVPPLRSHASTAGLAGFANMRRRRTQGPATTQDRRPSTASQLQQRKSTTSFKDPQHINRARFRHLAMSALMGNSNFHRMIDQGPRMADVVTKVKMIGDAVIRGTSPDVVRNMLKRPSVSPFGCFDIPSELSPFVAGDLLGKFTFASERYGVSATASFVEVEVMFHRKMPSVSFLASVHPLPEEERSVVLRTNSRANVDVPSQETTFGKVTVDYETREGSAKPGKDFILTQGTLVFDRVETTKMVKVPILHGKETVSSVNFYIILKNPTGGGTLGDPNIGLITILDEDDPGEFLFAEPRCQADTRTGEAIVHVIRENGFEGEVTIEYSTIDGTAVGGADMKPGVDYIHNSGVLKFRHGETEKPLKVHINSSRSERMSEVAITTGTTEECSTWSRKSNQEGRNFIIALRNPSVGAKIGVRSAVIVNLYKGRGSVLDELMERVEEVLNNEEEQKITWGGQFLQAMSIAPDKDEEGNETLPRWNDYFMHFFTFFWKVFCAIIPPTSIMGAWPSFFASLVFLGMMTTIVEQIGKLLGCVVGLETSVAGITIIALGTSLPDTFASRTAALQDENADAAIGNITGSNSVNVFLGLGLPWVLKTMHALIHGYTFKVKTDNLTQGVLIFGIVGVICVVTLLLRRRLVGGELGGSFLVKYSTAVMILSLWLFYVIVISLHAYGLLKIPDF